MPTLTMVSNREDQRAGMYLITTVLWFHHRFDRWPTTQETSRMKSYSVDALRWVRQMEYVVRERTEAGTINRVTVDGRELVKPPSLKLEYPSVPTPLPDEKNEAWLTTWVSAFYERNGRWPTPWHYRQCGLYQNDIALFRETLTNLVNMGHLVRIQIRRGRRNVTRLVDTTYCPHLKGKDGFIYYWSNADGPFPEP